MRASHALCPLSVRKGHCAAVIVDKKNGLSISNGLKGGRVVAIMMVFCVYVCEREYKIRRSCLDGRKNFDMLDFIPPDKKCSTYT